MPFAPRLKRPKRRRTKKPTTRAQWMGIAALVAGGALLLGGGAVYGAVHPGSPSSATTAAPTTSATTTAPKSTASKTSSPTTAPATSPADNNTTGGAAPSTTTPTTAAAQAAAKATTTLATLPVKGKAPATGYARTTDFGTAWLDVDHNGCDTRNDILARDLTATTKSGSCKVLTGTLDDPYTGATIHFVRGVKTSTLVQIDHVVPLENAWITGAQQLTQVQRESLANDPENLFAVDQHSNEQKSSGDAATWLPAAKSFRCTYVEHQIAVKSKYALWVAPAEHDAMARVLSGCTGAASGTAAGSPTGSASASAAASAAASPAAAPAATAPAAPAGPAAPAPSAAVAPAAPATVYYANCAAVRAAGKAPLLADQPGYSRKLDRDGDGVACEG